MTTTAYRDLTTETTFAPGDEMWGHNATAWTPVPAHLIGEPIDGRHARRPCTPGSTYRLGASGGYFPVEGDEKWCRYNAYGDLIVATGDVLFERGFDFTPGAMFAPDGAPWVLMLTGAK